MYNQLKRGLSPDAIIVHVDYSESYDNRHQDEIQSEYFGHSQFSIFTAVAYSRSPLDNELNKDCFAIVSEASDHSRIAAHTCTQRIIDEVIVLHPNLLNYDKLDVHIWSDGCSAQFRSRFVFQLTTEFTDKFNVTRYYHERHHGKGPMDGIGGCIKHVVYRSVLCGREIITTPYDFVECANRLVKNIRCLYLPEDDMLKEPEGVKNAPYCSEMQILQVHMLKRLITRAGFHCLRFFKIASDQESFHDQWYSKNDLEPCGHFDAALPSNDNCALCAISENGRNWIKCPRCDQWFHDDCFYNE